MTTTTHTAPVPVSVPEDIEVKKHELEVARLAQEKELKEKELDLQRRNISPLKATILAGAVGLIGTMIGGFLNLQVERQKQEGDLIIQAMKTGAGKEDQAAANLLFLSDAGLVRLSEEQKHLLTKKAGDKTAPGLPIYSTAKLGTMTDTFEQGNNPSPGKHPKSGGSGK